MQLLILSYLYTRPNQYLSYTLQHISSFLLSVNVSHQSKKKKKMYQSLKTRHEDFIHDYCSVGERLHSAPLGQRAGGFLRAEVEDYRSPVFATWPYSKGK